MGALPFTPKGRILFYLEMWPVSSLPPPSHRLETLGYLLVFVSRDRLLHLGTFLWGDKVYERVL